MKCVRDDFLLCTPDRSFQEPAVVIYPFVPPTRLDHVFSNLLEFLTSFKAPRTLLSQLPPSFYKREI